MSGNTALVNNNLQVIESITEFLNGTQAVWNSITLPIPLGMVVYATDTTVVKIGDGATLYGALPVTFVLSDIITFSAQYGNVNGLIAAAIAAVAAETNPYNQYVLKTSLSKSAIDADSIIYSPDAFVPPSMNGTVNLKSSSIIKTSKLCHISQSSYCAASGYMTSNTQPASGSALVNAVSNTGTASPLPLAIFPFNSSIPLTINYTFSKPRSLAEIIFFTATQSGVTSVTEVAVSAGGVTQNIAISPGAVNAVVSGNATFADVLVSGFSITVLTVNDGSQANLSVGFNVLFGDTGSQDISISGDTIASFNYNGQVISLTPTTDLPVVMSSIIAGHIYTLTLRTADGITLVPELLPIAPIWGDGNITYKNEFSKLTSDADPYYGTIAITGTQASSTNHLIYTTKNAIAPNSNVVTITQTLVAPTAIKNLNIKIPTTLSSGQGTPNSIAVAIVTVGGGSNTININPVYLNDGIFSTNDIFVDLSSYGALLSFQITLTSGVGTTCALSIIDVILPCLSYDESKHTWSDGFYRCIIGSANQLSNGVYQVTSRPSGNQSIIAVNDLLPMTLYQECQVPNPFNTENVTITPLTLFGDYTEGVSVQAVTDDFITVLCYSAAAYILKVVRL